MGDPDSPRVGKVTPRVGVSACLLGRAVRWDGRHKYAPSVAEALAGAVELVPVCPEVELGLGVPRPAMQLVREAGAVRLRLVEDGGDLTEQMRAYAERRVEELAGAGLAGYVLKSRSPSCGLNVGVASGSGEGEAARSAGLFAAGLRERLPGLPVVEEQELSDPEAREAFLGRVRRYRTESDSLTK